MRRREFISLLGSTAVWPLTRARTVNNAADNRITQQLIPWPGTRDVAVVIREPDEC
jgi:hypothetical protein